jgi:hypothetical protein
MYWSLTHYRCATKPYLAMLRLQYVEERGICICRLELSSHPLRLGYICTLRAGKCDGQFEATDDAGMFSNRVLENIIVVKAGAAVSEMGRQKTGSS